MLESALSSRWGLESTPRRKETWLEVYYLRDKSWKTHSKKIDKVRKCNIWYVRAKKTLKMKDIGLESILFVRWDMERALKK